MDAAPVVVTAPDGTVYEPVRAWVTTLDEIEEFFVADRTGVVLAATPVTGQAHMGRRRGHVECADGRWTIANPCATCGARGRLLRAEWEGGSEVPRRSGT